MLKIYLDFTFEKDKKDNNKETKINKTIRLKLSSPYCKAPMVYDKHIQNLS